MPRELQNCLHLAFQQGYGRPTARPNSDLWLQLIRGALQRLGAAPVAPRPVELVFDGDKIWSLVLDVAHPPSPRDFRLKPKPQNLRGKPLPAEADFRALLPFRPVPPLPPLQQDPLPDVKEPQLEPLPEIPPEPVLEPLPELPAQIADALQQGQEAYVRKYVEAHELSPSALFRCALCALILMVVVLSAGFAARLLVLILVGFIGGVIALGIMVGVADYREARRRHFQGVAAKRWRQLRHKAELIQLQRKAIESRNLERQRSWPQVLADIERQRREVCERNKRLIHEYEQSRVRRAEVERKNAERRKVWEIETADLRKQRQVAEEHNDRIRKAMELYEQERNERSRRRDRASAELKRILCKWQAESDEFARQFRRRFEDLERLKAEYDALRKEYENKRLALARVCRKNQLEGFLAGHLIGRGIINCLGQSRLAALYSRGVFTARDVEPSRIDAIPGVGRVLQHRLLAWRESLEKNFLSRAGGLTQDEISRLCALSSEYLDRVRGLESQMRAGVAELESITRSGHARKDALERDAARWVEEGAQAEADLEVLQKQ